MLLLQALTAATALASEHSGRAEVEHARLAELQGLIEAKHKELEEAQVRGSVAARGSKLRLLVSAPQELEQGLALKHIQAGMMCSASNSQLVLAGVHSRSAAFRQAVLHGGIARRAVAAFS